MQNIWTQEIRRESAGRNVRFDFPSRPLGWGRIIGVILIGFGIVFAAKPAQELWQVARQWERAPSGPELFVHLFMLPFVIAGCIPMVIGLLILFGRTRVEWKDGQLHATEKLGPFGWTRRLPREPIVKLEVTAAQAQPGTSNPNAPARSIERFSGLTAVFASGAKKLVVLGYPQEWLLGVAGELRPYVETGSSLGPAARVEVVVTLPQNENDLDQPQPPINSSVQVTERSGGVHFHLPPPGLRRGAKGIFLSSIIWCFMVGLLTTVVCLPGTKRNAPLLGILLFLSLFWLVGLALLAVAVNLGRRTIDLDADATGLTIAINGLFGLKQSQWRRDEIASIRVGESNQAVNDNDRHLLELQVYLTTGKKAGFLAGGDTDELRWLATRLRRAINVPARTA